jgi:hypothetical protein
MIIEKSHRQNPYIVFEKDPKVLIKKMMDMIRRQRGETV